MSGGPSLLAERAGAHLDGLRERGRLRRLLPASFGPAAVPQHPAVPTESTSPLDLTHNDYLGLRSDAAFQSAVRDRIARGDLSVGAGASRLLGGEHPMFGDLERAFAKLKGAEASLLFPSGYAANEAVVPALTALFPDAGEGGGGVRVFSDELNHASIIDGIRASGLPRERRLVFRHGDLDDLAQRLAGSDAALNIIVAESIFSMDGDVADLVHLRHLAGAHRGLLIVDEAHAVLCAGPNGRGLAGSLLDEAPQSARDALITIDTCGKAMGAQGAFVSGPSWLRELLVNTARTFIYTTAPSPFVAAALEVVIDRASPLEHRRVHLRAVAEQVHLLLRTGGFALGEGPSWSHIIPLVVGSDQAAMDLAATLAARGILVRAIRPPTVPEGTARLRLSLHAGMTLDDASRLAHAIMR